jgi:hypothetical protein
MGMSEPDIATSLKQEGLTPKEINDALNQSQIKSAISGSGQDASQSFESTQGTGFGSAPSSTTPGQTTPGTQTGPGGISVSIQTSPQQEQQGQYQPSTMEVPGGSPAGTAPQGQGQQANYYTPQPSPSPAPTPTPTPSDQPPTQGQEQEDSGYSADYSSYPYDSQAYGYNFGFSGMSDTAVEVAEQVFDEKIKNIIFQIEKLQNFKSIAESRIENIGIRLHKIELIIDKLQVAVLQKIGSYSTDLGAIRKEMEMMQDSFGKILRKKSK